MHTITETDVAEAVAALEAARDLPTLWAKFGVCEHLANRAGLDFCNIRVRTNKAKAIAGFWVDRAEDARCPYSIPNSRPEGHPIRIQYEARIAADAARLGLAYPANISKAA